MFAHHIQESLIAQIGAYNDPVASKALNDFALDPSKIQIYPISVCIKDYLYDLKALVVAQGLTVPLAPMALKYFAGTVQLFTPSDEFHFYYRNTNSNKVSTFRVINAATVPDTQYIVQDMIWSEHTSNRMEKATAIFTGVIIAGTY